MTDERHDDLLDRITDEIRREPDDLDPGIEARALARVEERLEEEAGARATETSSRVLGCSQIQELLPAHRTGDLTRERQLLIEDHLRSCLPCRRALRELEADGVAETGAVEAEETSSRPPRRWRWVAAAAAVVVVALVPFLLRTDLGPELGDADRLELAEGSLFVLEGDRARASEPGAALEWNTELRTPRGERAVVALPDGSRVEMRERSRLALNRGRNGTTLRLTGGSLIVEAADQPTGSRLYVATDDCLVSVVGTVFSVNDGMKGSRVSVFEGEVQVDQRGREDVLRAGDQVTTSANVTPVSLEEEVAWSPRKEQYLALVQEIAALDRELAALPRPQARYGSALLESMPPSTVIYAAFPNLTETWQTGLARLTRRISSEPALSGWMESGELEKTQDLLDRILDLGSDLGEEIVVAGWQDHSGEVVGPVLVAEALAPRALEATIDQELEQTVDELEIRRVEDPFDPGLAEDDVLLLYVSDRHLVAAPGARALAGMAASLAGERPGFEEGELYRRIADRYRDGVESLIAADLGSLLVTDADQNLRLARLGLADTEHLIVEQWGEGETTRRQAVVSFRDDRHGLAAWLAEPAPMGSLSFVSPDATSAFAVVFRRPERLFTDLLSSFTTEERTEVEEALADFEAEHGWDLEEDLFRPLGGELAFAVDGPLAPSPAWKLVVEVYDPHRLQLGLEQIVSQLSARMAEEGEGTLDLQAVESGLWKVTRVRPDGRRTEAVYGYFDGYLVAAPSAALVDRARRYRESEVNLLTSSRLRRLLPADAQTSFSALWFHDLSSVTEPLGGLVNGLGESVEMDAETREAVEQLQEGMGPSLAWAYGEKDQIVGGSSSPRSPLAWLGWLAAQGAIGG